MVTERKQFSALTAPKHRRQTIWEEKFASQTAASVVEQGGKKKERKMRFATGITQTAESVVEQCGKRKKGKCALPQE